MSFIVVIKELSLNIRLKKLFWEILLILAGTVAAIVLAGVEKNHFEWKNCKKHFEKFLIRDIEIRDTESFLIWSSAKWPGGADILFGDKAKFEILSIRDNESQLWYSNLYRASSLDKCCRGKIVNVENEQKMSPGST